MSQIDRLLDQLGDGIAAADDEVGLVVAARVVQDLERLAEGELGAPDIEASVVGRRFARVHRLLLGTATTGLLLEELHCQLALLDDPFAALLAEWKGSEALRTPEAHLRCSA